MRNWQIASAELNDIITHFNFQRTIYKGEGDVKVNSKPVALVKFLLSGDFRKIKSFVSLNNGTLHLPVIALDTRS
jgi:hypothetical protein